MAIPASDYLEAFQKAGQHLQACMDKGEGFRWIKARPCKPSFADLVFAHGQRLYAVLLAAVSSQKKAEGEAGVTARFELSREQLHLLLQECERYHLEPAVFPLWLGIMQPLTTGWNLFSPQRNMEPLPLADAPQDTPPTPMSEWEICNFCVELVVQELREEGLSIHSTHDIPGLYPNIWFRDAGEKRAWIAVLPTIGAQEAHLPKEVEQLRRKLPTGCVGYVARIAVSAAERDGEAPRRGESLTVDYRGLERLP